jgi:alpha-galactosidase
LTLAALLSVSLSSRAEDVRHGLSSRNASLAPTPPLGYNSYDSYGNRLNEEDAHALIKVMAAKYKSLGYEYFVIDAGWYENVEFYEGTKYPQKVLGISLDKYGLYEPSKMYFPGGIKALADYAHKNGIKLGVWIIRGIPKSAVEKNLPIKGTKYTARDIADTNSLCSWYHQNYGIDMSKPGAQEYYNSLIDKLAAWGIDFVKVDDMVPNPKEIVAVAKAIENAGHKMLYSLSPGDVHSVANLPYYRRANLMRITADVWDNQSSIDAGFASWEKYSGTEGDGFWPDLDMIPFGRLKVGIPESVQADLKEDQRSRNCRFTKDQMLTFITQRALAASPLIIGGDLLTMDDYAYSLLSNQDMLACNQNGVMGVNIYRTNQIDIWFTANQRDPKKGWIGIFNRSRTDKELVLSKRDLGLTEYHNSRDLVENNRPFKLRDIWGKSELILEADHPFSIPADGVVFLEFSELAHPD